MKKNFKKQIVTHSLIQFYRLDANDDISIFFPPFSTLTTSIHLWSPAWTCTRNNPPQRPPPEKKKQLKDHSENKRTEHEYNTFISRTRQFFIRGIMVLNSHGLMRWKANRDIINENVEQDRSNIKCRIEEERKRNKINKNKNTSGSELEYIISPSTQWTAKKTSEENEKKWRKNKKTWDVSTFYGAYRIYDATNECECECECELIAQFDVHMPILAQQWYHISKCRETMKAKPRQTCRHRPMENIVENIPNDLKIVHRWICWTCSTGNRIDDECNR